MEALRERFSEYYDGDRRATVVHTKEGFEVDLYILTIPYLQLDRFTTTVNHMQMTLQRTGVKLLLKQLI